MGVPCRLDLVVSEGGRHEACASKDAGPQREWIWWGSHVDRRKECWAQKRVDLVGVPHRLKKGTSASEDARPRRRVDCDVPHWSGSRHIIL